MDNNSGSSVSSRTPLLNVGFCMCVQTVQMALGFRKRGLNYSKLCSRDACAASNIGSYANGTSFFEADACILEKGSPHKTNFFKFIEVTTLKIVSQLYQHFGGVFLQDANRCCRSSARYNREMTRQRSHTFFVITTPPSYQLRKGKISFERHSDGLSVEPVCVSHLLREIENWRQRKYHCGPATKRRHPFSQAMLVGLRERFPPNSFGNAPRFASHFPNPEDNRGSKEARREPGSEPPARIVGILHVKYTPLPQKPLTRTRGLYASTERKSDAPIFVVIIRIKLQWTDRKGKACQ